MENFGDFASFRKMITPIIIQILFWIGIAACLMTSLGFIFQGYLGIGLVYLIIGPLMVRIYCELIILLFRIYDTLNDIKENTKRG